MKRCTIGLCWLIILLLVFIVPVGSVVAAPMLSGNVPLDSYVYDHLAKLDGLGLLRPMLTGSKPYNRLQVAGWVLEMETALGKQKSPSWLGKALLTDLRKEFASELSRLATGNRLEKPGVREWKFGLAYYNGAAAGYSAGRGTYQPLNKNGQGYRWDQGLNAYGSLRWEGSVGPDAYVSLTPRVAWGEHNGAGASLQSGYVKLRSGNTEFLFGKDAMSWGPGRMGNFLLTDNATSMTRVQISNIEPLRYRGWLRHLGTIQARVFLSILGDREYWSGGAWQDHNKPGFYGMRLDFQTAPDFTWGVGYTSMYGGRGIPINFTDYLSMIVGQTNVWNGQDKWNGQAGMDFRWRFPKAAGMQLYGGLYLEDSTSAISEMFGGKRSHVLATLAGIYFPRLSRSGNWDLNLEVAGAGKSWYMHSLYPGGHTYGGQLIGDPMGGDANRYSMRLNHYLNARTQVGLTLERVVQGAGRTVARPVSQRVSSVGLTLRHRLADNLLMEVTGGWASMDNADFIGGLNRKFKFASMQLTHRF
ncbi:MAG: capsule assembly Wzi family protein [Negativicutes bacterium]